MALLMKAVFCSGILALVWLAGCAARQDSSPTAIGTAASHGYTKPLSTPGARYGSLPTVVQATVLSEAGTAEIADVAKEKHGSRVIYKIYFAESRRYPPLLVGSDGSVLNPDLSVALPGPEAPSADIKVGDLPPEVTKVLKEKEPGAEVVSARKESWGEHTVYIISFKDEAHHPKLRVISDGTVVQPTS